ncbi:hypothetical protein [Nonomuraea sp. JJY05]|uniref:hypothetical protein n=1 Tax=Nonomuraea sp. JJY05 TaxID=3350255 RepID=UPI00373E49A8
MQFLAELDCAALAAYESDIGLPAEGTLLFFTTWDNAAAQVILLPPGAIRVPQRKVLGSGEASVFPETPLAAETVATWPTRGHNELIKLGDEFWDCLVGRNLGRCSATCSRISPTRRAAVITRSVATPMPYSHRSKSRPRTGLD